MAYIGKQGILSTTLTSKTLTTMVGNGSTTTLTLSSTPASVNDVAIYLDGIFQRPTNEYTLSGSTITFTTAPANNVFVCALVGGGEHIGSPMANSISTEKLADGTITNADIDSVSTSKVSGTLPALNANAVTGLNAANLVGSAMPAIDGSALTGITSYEKEATDPTVSSNKPLGTMWVNKTTGEMYICTDATTDANVWTNVGGGDGNIKSQLQFMSATGGSVSTDGNYKVHTFTSSGTFTPEVGYDAVGNKVEYLVIAGGGGGGNPTTGHSTGGGGAGGYLTNASFAVTDQGYTVTVGAGGVAADGSDSIFSTITSTGGGVGSYGGAGGDPGNGGSGGGGAGSEVGGTGTAGQGNNGGNGDYAGGYGGGGGGGSGSVGSNAPGGSSGPGGTGGNGTASDILVTGADVIRAGGGGGGGTSAGGAAGSGGAGAGSTGVGTNATVNTGSGGGGSKYTAATGSTGGSGIVILRYKFQ